MDTDTLTQIALIEAADGESLQPHIKVARNRFIIGCKADASPIGGISNWTAMKSALLFAGARTPAGACVPLRGSPIAYGLAGADQDQLLGMEGDGTGVYVDVNFLQNAAPQNSYSQFVAVTAGNDSAARQLLSRTGSTAPTGGSQMTSFSGGGAMAIRSREASGSNQSYASFLGFKCVSRSAGPSYSWYTDGSATTVTRASEAPAAESNYIYRSDTNYMAAGQRLGIAGVGEAVNPASLDARYTEYMAAIADEEYYDLPYLTKLSVTGGAAAGGNDITLEGINLDTLTGVTVGGVSATIAGGATENSAVITIPAGTAGATVSIIATNAAGSSWGLPYSYDPPEIEIPTITDATPDTGSVTGGYNVVLTGTDLGALTGVTVGGVSATIVSSSYSTATITIPAGTVGTVDIIATNSEGSSEGFDFTYTPLAVTHLLLGAVTTTEARFAFKLSGTSSSVRVAVSANGLFSDSIYSGVVSTDADGWVKATVAGLAPDTAYDYRIEISGAAAGGLSGELRTRKAGPHSFVIGTASCAGTDSDHIIFDLLPTEGLEVFFHTGDWHYEDIATNNVALYRAAEERVLENPRQANCWSRLPVYRMWDDHDYSNNDSGADSPSRAAACEAYRRYVPHPDLVAGNAVGNIPIYYAVTIGRVRFLVTDLRSQRSPKLATDNSSKVSMGSVQEAWFKAECLAAKAAGMAIGWVNTIPWTGTAGGGSPYPNTDGWPVFNTERVRLSNWLQDNDIFKRMFVLSGDMHKIAVAAPAVSNYATTPTMPGMPVFQAGGLDRAPADVKGGPYILGPYPMGSVDRAAHYGRVSITDEGGGTLGLNFEAVLADGSSLWDIDYTLDIAAPIAPPNAPTNLQLAQLP